MMNRLMGISLAFMLVILGTGCAHKVAFQDVDYAVDEVQRSEPMVAVITEQERTREVPVRAYMTGIAHSWEAQPGEMLLQVAEIELPQMFEQFRLVEEMDTDEPGFGLYLSIPGYLFAEFRARVTVRARLVDELGQELLDETYEAEGPSRGGRMFWGGAFAMKSAMRTSSLEAFKEIFVALRNDLNTVLDDLNEP